MESDFERRSLTIACHHYTNTYTNHPQPFYIAGGFRFVSLKRRSHRNNDFSYFALPPTAPRPLVWSRCVGEGGAKGDKARVPLGKDLLCKCRETQ